MSRREKRYCRGLAAGLAAAMLALGADSSVRAAEAIGPSVPAMVNVTDTVARKSLLVVEQPSSKSAAAGGQDYAQREARHPQAADFRGGDGAGIYIGGGAGLVIILLLVLILVR